jgi:8-oxo-dGTP diphosphatase
MEDRIRVAASAFVIQDGKALLVEFEDDTGLHYNFPGGGVELGETLEAGARREALEETSLDIEIERLLLVVESVGSRNSNWNEGLKAFVPWNEVRFFFLARPASASAEARRPEIHDANQTGVRWLPIEDLPNVQVLPQVSRELMAAMKNPSSALVLIPNPRAIEPGDEA